MIDKMREDFEAEAAEHDMDLRRAGLGYSDCNTDYGWIFWQSATLKAAPQNAETEAWLIEWGFGAGRRKRVFAHNAIGDYREAYKDATVHELVRRTPAPQPPQGNL
jgi:hypothetical protein